MEAVSIESAYTIHAMKRFREGAAKYNLPESLVGSLERYLEKGRRPGGFLTSVLTNDLFNAYARADSTSLLAMQDLVRVVYNYVECRTWGSAEEVDAWVERGGYSGGTQ